MVAHGNNPATKPRPLNSRMDKFAMILAGGETQANAWRLAYNKPNAKDVTAAQKGSRLAADPRIQARVASLKEKTIGGELLTVNDRLHKLSAAMNFTPKTPADRQALARLTDSYTKLAGGAQPDRLEVTGANGGPVSAVVQAAVTVQRAPVRARIAALRAAREARG